jgi:hypothetical protein
MENPVFEIFIKIRFPNCDSAYYEQWKERFNRREEWKYNDFTGRRTLQKIAPLLYPKDLNSIDFELLCLGDPEDDNPLCMCGACGHISGLMDEFSYLAAGFNGIESGDADDLGVQECGNCRAKLVCNW